MVESWARHGVETVVKHYSLAEQSSTRLRVRVNYLVVTIHRIMIWKLSNLTECSVFKGVPWYLRAVGYLPLSPQMHRVSRS
jgi:hypothetical protein